MNKPKVTFCLPTRNRIEWMPEALMSLLSQGEGDIEVIVIDDASDDGTKEFLDTWAVKDPRIRVIHNAKQMGAGYSRNLGSKEAQADIICQFDDDDISIQDRAQVVLEWFKENKNSELVTFPYTRIGFFNEVIRHFEGEPFNEHVFKETGAVNYFCNPSAAYKKKSFLETDGYQKENEKETDDLGFVRNWIKAKKKIDFCEGVPVVMHRVLPDSMMSKQRGWQEEWSTK